ncbi:MAG: von Willebrand factor A [Gammaproteobacteria bacterium (ex Lamellibrachia satsuma)]|nr:MAG: VWA domain-containing protein [Gammaproteobacteria bacterium (ex Lamellibrachia satsuma)]RRS33280.1 MAG: von Willebrand factor A [Gammaproteobacteria bacterium (ex Lamellibrachia satsuma)]RRS33860.1 MAG: von Willebrand factor A [Gammaproteobacteria bacterium (ex Lamellibrachia satsuma)]
MPINSDQLEQYRDQLSCGFEQLDPIFGDCMEEALALLSEQGVDDYLEGASMACKIGRGVEPVIIYLEEMPQLAVHVGEAALSLVSKSVWRISRSPNGKAILPFLQVLPEASRRLGSLELFENYVKLIMDTMDRTTGSVHGFHTTIPSPSLPDLLKKMPYLLSQLSCNGLKNWIDYGVRNYTKNPQRQIDYFSLQSADSRAILQRERHGTLFYDNERKLDYYMQALWEIKEQLVPYSEGFDELRKPMPYYDPLGVRVPDVYDDFNGVSGINRYRALLAHVAAHKTWTRQIVADNFSPFQRVAIEMFEDSRVEMLAMRHYPGLRRLWTALHPKPIEDDCHSEEESCIRHRLAMFSYALLNPDHGYQNPDLLEFVQRFHEIMAESESNTKEISGLAISYIARTRRQADLAAKIYFKDTEVSYRDDNRHMWIFIEEGDEEEMFDAESKRKTSEEKLEGLPPRHYPEWDYKAKTYNPDYVSLYESLHPGGNPAEIDVLLAKHSSLAKQLKKMLDLLKPQQLVRIRYQEEGSELDLDVAIRSLIDFKSGAQPDPRINMSHRTDGRDLAVMLLIDLSESVDQIPAGCDQSILQLSKEAVTLLGWAIEQLGDAFAIAGFSSNTRHEVRYQHIKGYGEHWDDTVKGRLASMHAGWSTRMGAAIRHASHYLSARQADKKLMLILTDGEPADIDTNDDRQLIEDSRKAVVEADQEGIYTYCINLDPKADEYVKDIFGNQYTVIDRVERLPEQLPKLFMALTK